MPYLSAVVDRIIFVRWRDATHADVPRVLADVQRAAAQARGALYGVAIVPADAAVPDDDIRKAMSRNLPELFKCVETMHFVVEGVGFRLAIVRSVIAALVFLSSAHRGKLQVHNTVDSALAQIKGLRTSTVDILERARVLGLLTQTTTLSETT